MTSKPTAKLAVVKRARYGGLILEFYGDIRSSDFYMTRDQIGRALEYSNPRKAIETIHSRYKKRLDPLSTVLKLGTVDGKEREVFLCEAKGVYEICRHSDKPNADTFYDFVYDILEGLRLGRLQIVAEKGTDMWRQTRQLAKETRKEETDSIKQFVEYARQHGSRNAGHYYTSLSNLANKAVEIKDRNFTEVEKLHNLHLVERIIAKVLREGMDSGRDYHDIFRDAKGRVQQISDLFGEERKEIKP